MKWCSVSVTAASSGRSSQQQPSQQGDSPSSYPLDCILIQITNFICPYQNPVCLYTESSLNEVKMCEGQADEGGGQQSSDSSTCDDKMFFFFFS